MGVIKIIVYFFLFALLASIYSCVEEVSIEAGEFESALVVEAFFTTENSHQQVTLSRTYPIETEGPIPEQNARVIIIENNQNEIEFEETSPGVYTTVDSVQSQINIDYQLVITTSNGSVYRSSKTKTTSTQEIDNLFVERIVNNNGEDGVSLFIDTFDPSGLSKFYRFEYEETYKIIAPLWRPDDLKVETKIEAIGSDCDTIVFKPRPILQKICYATQESNTIILANTSGLEGDRLSRFPVRFLNKKEFIISHRYSALVKQFVISSGAHNYLRILNDLSGSESLFSQIQPGFFAGNIVSESNRDEKVIGYFDVSFVSERRIFFNFEDFFSGESKPLFIDECETLAPPKATTSGCPLRGALISNRWKFLEINENPDPLFEGREGPYIIVKRVCGDCTAIGNSTPPNFWIE